MLDYTHRGVILVWYHPVWYHPGVILLSTWWLWLSRTLVAARASRKVPTKAEGKVGTTGGAVAIEGFGHGMRYYICS